MYFSKVAAVAAMGTATTALAQATQDAPVVAGNPAGLTAYAALPKEPFWTEGSLEGNVQGDIMAVSAKDGKGVDFKVEFWNLPKEGGPFSYHIHVDPVPEDGNCTDTLSHLDPYVRGEDPSCDSTKPQTCQVGDLAGKYGKIEGDESGSFKAAYHDPYSSLKEGEGSYFGNRSVVFHFANKTRISCANFAVKHGDGNSAAPRPTPIGGGNGTSTYPTSPVGTGGYYPTPTGSSMPMPGAGNAVAAVAKNFAVVGLAAGAWMLL